MANFLRIYIKTLAFFASILTLLFLTSLIFTYYEKSDQSNFVLFNGDKDSSNIIAIIDIDGLIIEVDNDFSRISNRRIISPTLIRNYLIELEKISPDVIIFSINSPGGTVSASKEIYDLINNFKTNHNIEVYFHTNELLASGSYWAAIAGDKIFANYGAIIGSIGARGPDWFFYDEPKSISMGLFGSEIETKKSIKVYTNTSGKSKDLLNPFRKPSDVEIAHLEKMVNEIYYDFVRTVSKERKIEDQIIIDNIGALIYTSKSALQNHLIDEISTLDNLIKKIINKKNFTNHKIIKNLEQDTSLLREVLTSLNSKFKLNANRECLILRSSISVVLNYQSTGC